MRVAYQYEALFLLQRFMILYTIRKGLRKGGKEANESKDHYRGRS